jgi:hypothetical protein
MSDVQLSNDVEANAQATDQMATSTLSSAWLKDDAARSDLLPRLICLGDSDHIRKLRARLVTPNLNALIH